MKKVLSMIAALLLCVGTQAQIVSSRSAIVKTEKQASSTQWFLRAGLNIMNFSGDGAVHIRMEICSGGQCSYRPACRSLCQLRLHEQNESRRREHQLGRLRRLHGS